MNLKELIFGKKINPAGDTDSAHYINSIQKWLPVEDIRDGVVISKDGHFIKILEVLPVNFDMKSAIEQNTYIYYFASYLKIAPDRMQVLSVTKKADTLAYIQQMRERYEKEENESCREMIEDNIAEIQYLSNETALTRRFFITFQYEERMRIRTNNVNGIIQRLNEEEETARHYLDMCGLEVLMPDYSDIQLVQILYMLLNRTTSNIVKPPLGVFSMVGDLMGVTE